MRLSISIGISYREIFYLFSLYIPSFVSNAKHYILWVGESNSSVLEGNSNYSKIMSSPFYFFTNFSNKAYFNAIFSKLLSIYEF